LQTSQNLASSRRLSLSNSWYFLASALVALGAFTLLALQRGALGSLGTAPAWAWPSIATGTAIGAVALGWLALTRFAREAEAQPYVWTAPLLVIFCFAPLSQLSVKLPLPGVQLTPFLIGAGTLIVGGGAFGRVPSAGARTLGATLTLTPTLMLVLGYVLQSGTPRGALAHVDGAGLWLLGMTLFAGLGALVIAIVARALEQVTAHGQASLAIADAGRLAELVQHAQAQWTACQHELARLAEERQLFEAWLHDQRTQLAQQVRGASQAPVAPPAPPAGMRIPDPTEPRVRRRATAAARPPSDDTAEFMAMARPGLGWATKLALVSLALAGLAAGAYFGWYKPQLLREQAELRAAQEAAAVQAADVAALRDKIAAEQARAAQVLEDERTKADAARKQAEVMAAEAAAQTAAAAAAEAAAAEAAATEAAAAKASATRRAKKQRASAKTSERRVARAAKAAAAAEDDPIAGLDGI